MSVGWWLLLALIAAIGLALVALAIFAWMMGRQ